MQDCTAWQIASDALLQLTASNTQRYVNASPANPSGALARRRQENFMRYVYWRGSEIYTIVGAAFMMVFADILTSRGRFTGEP